MRYAKSKNKTNSKNIYTLLKSTGPMTSHGTEGRTQKLNFATDPE
jgi:hypothetical protein